MIIFHVFKRKCWALPCPYLMWPTMDLTRDVGGLMSPLGDPVSSYHSRNSERSQGKCPDVVGAAVLASALLLVLSLQSWVFQLSREDGNSDKEKGLVI